MGLKHLVLVALLLSGCGTAPATLAGPSAAYLAPDDPEAPGALATLAVVNGTLVDPIEPEGFATDTPPAGAR